MPKNIPCYVLEVIFKKNKNYSSRLPRQKITWREGHAFCLTLNSGFEKKKCSPVIHKKISNRYKLVCIQYLGIYYRLKKIYI